MATTSDLDSTKISGLTKYPATKTSAASERHVHITHLRHKHLLVIQVSKLFADASCISLTAFISPYRADRAVARELHEKASLGFVEVFIDAPLHVVEARDPKGLYKKARAGEIKGTPTQPTIIVFSAISD